MIKVGQIYKTKKVLLLLQELKIVIHHLSTTKVMQKQLQHC